MEVLKEKTEVLINIQEIIHLTKIKFILFKIKCIYIHSPFCKFLYFKADD